MSSNAQPLGLSDLNDQFGLPGHISFIIGPGDLPIAVVKNQYATAKIAIYGAHIFAWQPHEQEPVLWLSQSSIFKKGKAIRGGIPICWPWFANHPTDNSKPAHGFARTSQWNLDVVEATSNGSTHVQLSLTHNKTTQTIWPYAFKFVINFIIGEQLTVELTTQNLSTKEMIVTGALHSYLNIGDAENTTISGLENTRYIDKLSNMDIKQHEDSIYVTQAMDRIYINTDSDCIIEDKSLKRRIRVEKMGSRSTVLWNPWKDTAAAMKDFDNDGYKNMVCVEASNADPDSIRISADNSHTLTTCISSNKSG